MPSLASLPGIFFFTKYHSISLSLLLPLRFTTFHNPRSYNMLFKSWNIGAFVALGASSIANAMPTAPDGPIHARDTLVRRRFNFPTPQNVDRKLPSTFRGLAMCSEPQGAYFQASRLEALQLAEYGAGIETYHIAYKTFMDGSAPPQGDELLSESQENDRDKVRERFRKVQELLADNGEQVDVICADKTSLVQSSNPADTRPPACIDELGDELILTAFVTHVAQTPTLVLCPQFFEVKELNTKHIVNKDTPWLKRDFCKEPGNLLEVVGRASSLLHELMHLRLVATMPAENGGVATEFIIDCVYGPYLSSLLASQSDPEDRKSFINADNYAMLALARYMEMNCPDGESKKFWQKNAPDIIGRQPMGLKANFDRCKFDNAGRLGLPVEPFPEESDDDDDE